MLYNAKPCTVSWGPIQYSTIIIMYCEVSMPETNGEPEPQLLRFKIILC